jgi:hypothetical protein
MNEDMPKAPTVDENSTILKIAHLVAIVTSMWRDNLSHSQGRPVSTKEDQFIIA